MESLDYWRLCDELSVIHAALLIVGIDPSSEQGSYCDDWKEHDQPKGYAAAKTALINAIKAKRLPAAIRSGAEKRYVTEWDEGSVLTAGDGPDCLEVEAEYERPWAKFVVKKEPDWRQTTVSADNLKAWLRTRGFTTGFFFPSEEAGTPGYLDPNNPRYSPKLAAAVSAWLAVEQPSPGKSTKQTLDRWLKEHASTFGLTNDEGDPVTKAMEECSAVANWDTKGGANKTPG